MYYEEIASMRWTAFLFCRLLASGEKIPRRLRKHFRELVNVVVCIENELESLEAKKAGAK